MAASDQISQLAKNIRNTFTPESRTPRFSSLKEMREFGRKTPLQRKVSQIPEGGREALDPRNFGGGGLAGVIRRVGPKKKLLQLSEKDLERLIVKQGSKGKVKEVGKVDEALGGPRYLGFVEKSQPEQLGKFLGKLKGQNEQLRISSDRLRNIANRAKRLSELRHSPRRTKAIQDLREVAQSMPKRFRGMIKKDLRKPSKNKELDTSELFQDFDPLRNTDELL